MSIEKLGNSILMLDFRTNVLYTGDANQCGERANEKRIAVKYPIDKSRGL